ncbi:MAG: HlyD family secretion protein [Chloroflexota bacterium]
MTQKKLFWMLALSLTTLGLGACQASATPTAPVTAQVAAGPIAQGHIEPQFSQDVAFTLPGQVHEVLVAEGDVVVKDQVLARLGGDELRAVELARAEQELLSAQQNLDGLQSNAERLAAQSAAAVSATEKAMADAQEQYDALKNPDAAQRTQIEARLALLEQQLADAEEKLQNIEALTNPDPLELAQAKVTVADLEVSLADAQEALDALNNPDPLLVAQLEASLPLLEAELATARNSAASLADGVDDDLLAAAQARLKTAQAVLALAEANVASAELRAPAAGTIVGLNLLPGQVVAAGVPVLTLADLGTWVVKTDDLTELEVVAIADGQAVKIILDALPDMPIDGTVSEIAQRFEDRRGDVTYTVTITLAGAPASVRWGMTGQVQFPEDQ